MKTGIMTLAIAVVLLMVTIQSATAGVAMTTMGTIKYENGDTCPYGWDVWMENMNASYGSEPWDYTSEFLPPYWDYQVSGEKESDDYFHVWVESPDEKWFGANTAMFSEAWNDTWWIVEMHITMYEQAQQPDTFTKSLALGWNLISLPLTPKYSSTSAVLGNDTIVYDAVYRYDATSKEFEDVTTGTMDPGTGYFVNVTTAGTWSYDGRPFDEMSIDLKQGLNMVGWVNETDSALPGALDSIAGNYRYVARWDATSQSYEVYLPGAPDVFNDFATMERGEGYFIAATAGCMLTYP